MIFLLGPSISATSPESRKVTANMSSMSQAFILRSGRSAGGTTSFQVSRISFMPYSGGNGGTCCT